MTMTRIFPDDIKIGDKIINILTGKLCTVKRNEKAGAGRLVKIDGDSHGNEFYLHGGKKVEVQLFLQK